MDVQLIPPSENRLTNVAVLLTDSIGVRLSWTAPPYMQPAHASATRRYHIKITEAVITTSMPVAALQALPDHPCTVLPGLPGTVQAITLGDLLPGRTYYVCVLYSEAQQSNTQLSAPSNIVSFQTAFSDRARTTTPQRIPLQADKIWDWMLPVEYDSKARDHQPLESRVLADQRHTITENGVPVGQPANVKGVDTNLYGFLHTDWYNMPAVYTVFDLEKVYDITGLYLITPPAADGSDNGGFMARFQVSADGANYITVGNHEENYAANGNSWYAVPLDTPHATGVRYFRIAWIRGEGRLTGITLYGYLTAPDRIAGVKYKRNVRQRTFSERMGINCFLQEGHPAMIAQVATVARLFNDANWIMGDGLTDAGPAGWNSQPQDIRLRLQSSYMWNFDQQLTAWKNSGMENLFCITNEFAYMRDAATTPKASEAKSVDPRLNNHDLGVTTDPHSYRHYARIAYNLAARYGKNTSADTQYIQLATGDEMKRGLQLVDYWTAGNERDATWGDQDRYNTAAEVAARMSAVYDGHKGALGAGYGFATADPAAKMTTCSLYYSASVGYMHETLKWWDVHRGMKDYPVHAFDIHVYNTWEQEVNTPMYSNVPKHAAPPEKEQFWRQMPQWIAFRDTQAPDQECWITEIGYDEQLGGTNAPDFPTQAARSQYKAWWLMRTFLLMEYMGIDLITLYWYANTTTRVQELKPDQKVRDTFLTSGIADGVKAYNDWANRKPLVSWWYLAALKQDMEGFSYSHPIMIYGEAMTQAPVLLTAHPKLFVLAFVNHHTGDKALVLWIVDALEQHTDIDIQVDAKDTSIHGVKWEGAASGNPFIGGITFTVNTVTAHHSKHITLQVGECPLLIKTRYTGIGMLLAPDNVHTQVIEDGSILLAWTDKNPGANHTQIWMSARPDAGFALVQDSYIDNGEYTVKGLNASASYYFKIQFTDGDRHSPWSAVKGSTARHF